jgi:septal ring factor EnvC (AmiA/AmiB activator)
MCRASRQGARNTAYQGWANTGQVTLGEIVLPRDDEFEFNPFEWAQASAKAHAETLQELAQLKSRASGEVDVIAKLNAQLDDFIKTKDETENEMLQQFMDLLNEKKRKIRDQSRLLAGAKVDKSVGKAMTLAV